MKLAERIDTRRRDMGISELELLRRARLNPSWLKDLRRNPTRRPRIDSLRQVAAALQWSVADLLKETGLSEDDLETPYQHDTDGGGLMFSRGPPLGSDGAFLMVPEFNVRAAAGGGAVIESEDVRAVWPFARAFFEEQRLDPRTMAIVEIVGDSMSPTLQSGDKVMIDRNDQRLTIPGLFVIWDGDGLVAKRIERIWAAPGEGLRVKLVSDNPLHTPYEVNAEWVNVIGRVVWFARRC